MKVNWAEKTVQTVMTRRPKINPHNKWEYEDGLVLDGIYLLWKETKDEKYLKYIKDNMDFYVDGVGNIPVYSLKEFNIDHVNNGKILIDLYLETKDERYKTAIDQLREQLRRHPRTSEGAFWHKLIYPYQIWLDGLFMGSVFYAKYINHFAEEKDFSDVVKQFVVSEKNTKDPKTGLLYHAWDEKKVQPWANPETGLSENFWGRSIGWYVMALVDTIENLPKDSDDVKTLTNILLPLLDAIMKFQDDETKLWYQVFDAGKRKGNYLESSASCMLVAAIAKAYRLGLVDKRWKNAAIESYENLITEFITETKEGLVNVNKMCYVAGLGGADNRDGTYTYYISEPIVANDHKGVGAFIQASVQVQLIDKKL